jgi:GAF domain-containing protein
MKFDKENDRLNALKRYDILDSPPDGTYDEMTKLAATIFNVPIAIVSLVDEDRIWFKSHYGLQIGEIPRSPGLCSSAILSDDLYLVEDARNDPRTLANPLVAGDLGLQFYAAAPLTTPDGHNIGTFCIIDKMQRFMNSEQKGILEDMAKIVMKEIALRLKAKDSIAELHGEIAALKALNKKQT